MTKNEYIEIVLSRISSKKDINSIRQEVADHIDDRIEYYTDAGYDYEYAKKAALSKMGEPDRLGLQLNSLHNYVPLMITVIITQILYAIIILIPLIAVIIAINDFFVEFNYSKLILIQSAAEVLLFTVNYYLSSKLLSKASFYVLGILTFLDSVISTISDFLVLMYTNALKVIDCSDFTDIPHKVASFLSDSYHYIFLIMVVVSICYGAYLKNRMSGKSKQLLAKRYYNFNYAFIFLTIICIILTIYVLINI